MKPEDPENQNMKAAQVAQNKMLRMLDGVSLKEHISSRSLLQKYNLPSVNQLAGEIKLLEAWKATHITSYPFQLDENNPNRQVLDRSVRPNTLVDMVGCCLDCSESSWLYVKDPLFL